jgi:hypothetical protein
VRRSSPPAPEDDELHPNRGRKLEVVDESGGKQPPLTAAREFKRLVEQALLIGGGTYPAKEMALADWVALDEGALELGGAALSAAFCVEKAKDRKSGSTRIRGLSWFVAVLREEVARRRALAVPTYTGQKELEVVGPPKFDPVHLGSGDAQRFAEIKAYIREEGLVRPDLFRRVFEPLDGEVLAGVLVLAAPTPELAAEARTYGIALEDVLKERFGLTGEVRVGLQAKDEPRKAAGAAR